MKLAEGLVLRADRQRRVAQLQDRLQKSALVQEGDTPPEDPAALFEEFNRLLNELERLIIAINRTNLAATLPDGRSLTVALAQRDTLKLRHAALKSVADVASARVERYSQTEIRRVSTVDVAALRRETDDLARRLRELDTAIQATNWTVELNEGGA